LEISVYGEADLAKTQTVRPDGKIAFPLIGDVQASGTPPEELREQIRERLSRYVRNPQVTVIVTKYNSKQVIILGEVRTPGMLHLVSDVTLLQGISRVGGVTDEADLQGALVVRNHQILPVSFEKLLKHGDMTQNIPLQSKDTILIPNFSAKKAFVLGEVNKPLVLPLNHEVRVIESIALAGGFTRDARMKNVVLIRGGLGNARVEMINADAMMKNGDLAANVVLHPNDIVYIPKTLIANVDRFFEHLRTIITPIVLAEAGMVLYPDVQTAVTKGTTRGTQPALVGP
jgi:polysaccharide export outer membrane protein